MLKKLLNDRVLLFYYSWKNGHLFKNFNKKLPSNIKNVILKKI